MHWELWIRSQPSKHNTPQTKKFERDPKSGILVPKGYCWKYHRGLKCIGCSFKHSCPLCALNHQMVKCSNFRPSKRKSVSAILQLPTPVRVNRLEFLLEGYDFEKKRFLVEGFKRVSLFFLLVKVYIMNLLICYQLEHSLM